MVARVLGTYSRAWSQARHTVTTCAAHQIAVWVHGTTLFVLLGLGASTTTNKTCHCLFEGTTLPEESAAYYGNPLYGTNCEEEWDEMPGTKYYVAGKTDFGAEGEEYTKECNWRHAR